MEYYVGFNPCCIGLGIQTTMTLHQVFRVVEVSILVVLDWVFKHTTKMVDEKYYIGFNPCCIGLGIQTPPPPPPPSFVMPCFNPCCIGLGIQTSCRRHGSPAHAGVSILVVLDWVFKRVSQWRKELAVISFNPCCIGLGIQTHDGQKLRCFMAEFQSLLYWIGYSNHAMYHLAIDEGMFQSLLYWIGYSNVNSFEGKAKIE